MVACKRSGNARLGEKEGGNGSPLDGEQTRAVRSRLPDAWPGRLAYRAVFQTRQLQEINNHRDAFASCGRKRKFERCRGTPLHLKAKQHKFTSKILVGTIEQTDLLLGVKSSLTSKSSSVQRSNQGTKS